MDIQRLSRALKTQIGTEYRARHPAPGVIVEIPDFQVRVDKLNRVLRKAGEHRTWEAASLRWSKARATSLRRRTRAAAELAQGERLLSFDIEFAEESRETFEIGWTVIDCDVVETYNYRVAGAQWPHSCDFAETIEAPLPDIIALLSIEAAKAHAYVGHGLYNDFEHLEALGHWLPVHSVYDTAILETTLHADRGKLEDMQKLTVLCERYGIACPRPHSAGNDSRYTLEVLLRMLRVHPLEALEHA